MPSPNQPTFYYDPMNPAPYLQYLPALNNNLIVGSNRINKINKFTNNSINKLFNNNLHFKVFFIQYRYHNQDDSDSSEHNKSVQVESEEEEEPVRQTGKKPIGKKAPAKRWSDEEEVALARSCLTISENPDVGNAQKMDGFYRNVTDHFHHLMNDKSRTVLIYSKWKDMNSSMKKWNGFYQQASINRKSGKGDEQVLKKAMKNYKSVVKSNGGIQLIQQRGIPTKISPSRRKTPCFARGERRTHPVNAPTTTSLRRTSKSCRFRVNDEISHNLSRINATTDSRS
ncbi:hypothetical protein R6Q57_009554 [Mikania cordata]